MCLIVLVDEAHAVEIEENDVRIPCEHLLGVDVERAGLTGRVGEVLGVDERERAVAGLRAFKAVLSLEGHTADVDGRLLIVRDLGRARVEIGLDALEVLGQLLCARFQTIELAEQADGLVGGVVERGVAAGHNKDRDAGLRAQLVRVARGVGAHDDDLRRDVDDLLHVRLAVRAGDGQILELVEVHVVIQAAHAGLGLIILHADGTVGRADIAAVAQRTDADAHDALHLLGHFHGAVFAVGECAHIAGGVSIRLCAAGRAGQHHQSRQKQADPSSISHSEYILSSCVSPFRSIVISITDGGQKRNPPWGIKVAQIFAVQFADDPIRNVQFSTFRTASDLQSAGNSAVLQFYTHFT